MTTRLIRRMLAGDGRSRAIGRRSAVTMATVSALGLVVALFGAAGPVGAQAASAEDLPGASSEVTSAPSTAQAASPQPRSANELLAGTPWRCDAFGYLFQSPRTGGHDVIRVDLVTGDSRKVASTPNWVNAAGYNVLDNYVYAYQGEPPSIVRVSADGSVEELGMPDGVNQNLDFVVGDVDSDGHYWMMALTGRSGQWYEIDLAPGSSSGPTVLSSGTAMAPEGFSTLPADWAYIDGVLYGVEKPASGIGPAHLIGFDTTTHQASDLGPLSRTAAQDTPFGAVFVDSSGYLYASNNRSGDIFRIDPRSLATDLISHGPTSFANDGVRCPAAAIPTITVTKTVAGRVQPGDQFTVSLSNDAGDELKSVTTRRGPRRRHRWTGR